MPVAPRGYRRWEPSGRAARPAWLVIAARGIRFPLRRRGFLQLLLAAWVPAIVKGGILYFAWQMGNTAQLLGGSWTAVTPAGFLEFLRHQTPFVLVVLALVGAGAVCDDRRDNGLALYLSRPLGVWTYVAGKAAIILCYYLLITLLPVLALSVFGYLVTSGGTGLSLLLEVPARATAYCLVSGVSLALVVLALSAAGRRRALVMIAWGLLIVGSKLLGQILGALRPGLRIIDVMERYLDVGALLLDGRPTPAVPAAASLAVVLLLTAGAVLVLRRRVRPVEVVS